MENTITVFAVGTHSRQKIRNLTAVLDELGVSARLVSTNSASGVSDQPLSSDETLEGAMNRAESALLSETNATYGIGIEIGCELLSTGKYAIFCWTVVINRSGQKFEAKSHSFLLPEFHQKVLRDGNYLGDHVGEYAHISSEPAFQAVAEIIRTRALFITESVRYALIYALHDDYYS